MPEGPTPPWMHAPSGGRCLVCGELLGAEPHMIVAMPDGEHSRCRDWSAHPWPHARLQRAMRTRYRAIQRALAEVVALGRWLEQRRQMWPRGAAETVAVFDRRKGELARALDRVGVR
jgi:hypothetical protein